MPRMVFLLLFALALIAGGPAAAKRVALVIGNDAYENVDKLQKAVNDAKAIGATLEGIGFTVLLANNLSRREMNRQLQLFAARLEAGDEALFFFAGHGVEIAGRNYLLPTDIPNASPGQENFVKSEAIPVDQVLDGIRGRGTRISILILDACRNNPFPKSGTRSLGGTRGLARMPAPKGTFIMYSAGVGQTALDRLGDGDPHANSVFTRSLIPLLKRPGLSLTETARQVRRSVERLAGTVSHDQRPAYYDEVTGDFFFAGRGASTRPPAVAAQPGLSAAAEAWSIVKDTKTAADLEVFIEEYPGSFYAKLAKARLAKLNEMKVAIGVFPQQPKAGRRYSPGEEFRDCDNCPEMVVLPAGSFMMGSPASEKQRDKDEGPQHTVTISKPFAVGKFEVTFAEWDVCVAYGRCGGYRPGDKGWGRDRRPVINVSWDDAKAYVTWLSRKTGKTYRLLSEAEWEYAARAGTTTPFSTGGEITTDQANFNDLYSYKGSRKDRFRQQTVLVGTFGNNAFGLHDMHGNVGEWVEDCYKNTYRNAPADGSARTLGSCDFRILRGGSWDGFPRYLRTADRDGHGPGIRFSGNGFRLARTLTP